MALGTSSRLPRFVHRRALVAAVGAVAIFSLAACSSSSTPASTSAPAATGSTAAASPAPTGTPITTMTLSAVNYNGPTYKAIQVIAQVYAQWINSRGGINGHPLNALVCDDKGVGTQTVACARQAVSAGAVADVGSFTFTGTMDPVYNAAHTAVFGNCCNLYPDQFSLPNTFQTGDNPALNNGGIARAVHDGCKNIAVLGLDLGAITTGPQGLFKLFQNTATAFGYKGTLKEILVPLTSTDLTPQVIQATTGTDCISMFLSGSNISALMPAFAQTGGTQRLYGAQGNFDIQSVGKQYATLPGVASGVVYGAYPPLANAAWDNLRAALKQFNAPADLDYNSLAALGTWEAFDAFTQITSKMTGPINNATFLAAASSAQIQGKGMVPDLDFTKTYSAFGGAYLRDFNNNVTFFTFANSTPVGPPFVDLGNAMQGIATTMS